MRSYKIIIDLVEEALSLPDEEYNEMVVELFDNADDDAHVSLMKKMLDKMYQPDKKEFIEYCRRIEL